MTLTISAAALLALSASLQCAVQGICVAPAPEVGTSKIELWASAGFTPVSSGNRTVSVGEISTSDGGIFPASANIVIKGEKVLLDVPFTSQAPFHNWAPPYNEACEEASIIMVEYYLRGEILTPEKADMEIKKLIDTENRLGLGIDISSGQAGNLASEIYGRNPHAYTGNEVNVYNIKRILDEGNPVIVPVSGQDLDNPYFTGSGPPYHMIVLTGYDADNFFAHDPGTQYGKNYPYPQSALIDSIHEWTGSKSTVREGQKAMLVLQKSGTSAYVAAYGF